MAKRKSGMVIKGVSEHKGKGHKGRGRKRGGKKAAKK